MPANRRKYTDKVINKTQPAVIIYPKYSSQPISRTKSEIMQLMDPTTREIPLSRVRHVRDGGRHID